jgi:hypothetical protein
MPDDTSDLNKKIKELTQKIHELEAQAAAIQRFASRIDGILESLLAAIGSEQPPNRRPVCDWRRGIRRFRSGVVSLTHGQTARVHVVNTTLELGAATKSAWVQGWANPRSEPLGDGAGFSLPSGASVFQDFHPDPSVAAPQRAHIRVMVTVLDDPCAECVVTFEALDDESGRTTMMLPISEVT